MRATQTTLSGSSTGGAKSALSSEYVVPVVAAAARAGPSGRLFIIDASSGADEEPELEGFKKVFINPEIVELSGDEWIMNEGCLSLPEIREDVTRPDRVKIKYMDENFDPEKDSKVKLLYLEQINKPRKDHMAARVHNLFRR